MFDDLKPHHITIGIFLLSAIILPFALGVWKRLQEANIARLAKTFHLREETEKLARDLAVTQDKQHRENKDYLDTITLNIKDLGISLSKDIKGVNDRVDRIYEKMGGGEWNGTERRSPPGGGRRKP